MSIHATSPLTLTVKIIDNSIAISKLHHYLKRNCIPDDDHTSFQSKTENNDAA